MIIDISIPFAPHVPEWPGDTPFSCGWTARREDGSSVNLASLHLSAHSGTHADAPLHVESDWAASESLPAAAFVGEALVATLPPGMSPTGEISADMLRDAVGAQWNGGRLLLRTGCSVSSGTFPDEWPSLAADAVEWLVSRGVRLFGVDAPSVDARTSKTLPVHHGLFASGAYVLENLALAHVAPGAYELLAQPLLVHGADAAPVRALLRPRL